MIIMTSRFRNNKHFCKAELSSVETSVILFPFHFSCFFLAKRTHRESIHFKISLVETFT